MFHSPHFDQLGRNEPREHQSVPHLLNFLDEFDYGALKLFAIVAASCRESVLELLAGTAQLAEMLGFDSGLIVKIRLAEADLDQSYPVQCPTEFLRH